MGGIVIGLWDAVTSLPGDIANSILNALGGLLSGFIQPLLEIARVLFTVNINPFDFQDLWLIIISVISCFYLILFLVVGLKFLFGSYDAVQRKDAKEWFKRAILLLITVNASLLLYSLLLSLSSGVATFLWNSQLDSLFFVENLSGLDVIWLTVFGFSLFVALISLVVRHIFLIIGVMLFPVGLFLYFVEPVKEYGSMILNLVGAAAFMNVLDVIILIAVQLFWTEFAYLGGMSLLAQSVGFLFVCLANYALFWFAIQKALNSMGIKVDVVETVKNVVGPAIMAAL